MLMLFAALFAGGVDTPPGQKPLPQPMAARTPNMSAPQMSRRAAPVAKTVLPEDLATRRARVLAAVRAEWGHYDVGNKGRLTPLEFSTWVMHANGARVAQTGAVKGQGIKPVTAMNATATAFSRADANHDGGVTPEEMANFLTR